MPGYILRYLACLLLLLTYSHSAFAIQASPHTVHEIQPDGSSISLRIHGDEKFHWYEDMDGYTVVRDGNRYVYAQLNAKQHLAPTTLEVGKVSPVGQRLKKRILPPRNIINSIQAQRSSNVSGQNSALQAPPAAAVPAAGTVKNLVIMIRFANHTGRTLPSNSEIDILFNQVGGDPTLAPTGSIRDVYFENSYSQMTLESTVVGWVDVPNTEQYYANGDSGDSTLWQALTSALTTIDATIDFNDFDTDNDGDIDSIAFIHSGYGAEWGGTDSDGTAQDDRIWSHRWTIQPDWVSAEGVRVSDYHISPGLWSTSGSAIGRIGVISHETGHFFGLPDLYDITNPGEGIGSYGLMANSWGFDFSQYYPPHFSPWSKIFLGWVSPTVISAAGNYNIAQAETSPAVYRIDKNYPSNEYLLIENRQPVGFDGDMPQGGLAIWHIDDNAGHNNEGFPGQAGWPTNGNHYQVALLQADGNYDLEQDINRGDAGDVYHAGGISSIDSNTLPDTNAYQGGIILDTLNAITAISVASSNMSFTLGETVQPPPEYYVRDEVHEARWLDTSSGTEHTLTDNDSTSIAIGFDFPFYDDVHTNVTVSSNGYLTFGNDGAIANNSDLPDAAIPNQIIAPFWDDLIPTPATGIQSLTEGIAPYRRLTISWIDISAGGLGGTGSFQATLYEANGDIVFRYLDVDFGDVTVDFGMGATVGVEDATGGFASKYGFNQPTLSDGLAMRFSTRKDFLVVDDDNDAPDVSSYYTDTLDALGLTYDTTNIEPNASLLDDYKGVIWFSGDKFGGTNNSGPNSSSETALGAFLDAGACLFISSQDYFYDNGLTSFMTNYLGAASVTNDVTQTTATGSGSLFGGLGPYTLAYPAGLTNFSDSITATASAETALIGSSSDSALTQVTADYSTSFWVFPYEALPTVTDRQASMNAIVQQCHGVKADNDADGSSNAFDTDDDNDTLSDLLESMILNTDPFLADTDGDGLSDFVEVNQDGDPNNYTVGTDFDPLTADTDGDGYDDGVEVSAGSDPLNPASIPAQQDGDINEDGFVDVRDILLGNQVLMGLTAAPANLLQRGDVAPLINGIPASDGQFNLGDLLVIQRKVLGQITF